MKCQYCNSLVFPQIFPPERNCPQCGAPVPDIEQNIEQNRTIRRQSPKSNTMISGGWYATGEKTLWGTTPSMLFALLGVLFFFPVPGLFCFALAGEQTFLVPIALLIISFLFVSLGHPNRDIYATLGE